MKIKSNKLFWLLGLVLVFSCETTELDNPLACCGPDNEPDT